MTALMRVNPNTLFNEFERMFERDKDELRSMGIPVETVLDVNGEVRGYRIPQESYALAEVDLTFAERAAVAVAAQVWGQAFEAPLFCDEVEVLNQRLVGENLDVFHTHRP